MKVSIRRAKKPAYDMFQPLASFPSRESEPDRLSPSAFPVVRVLSRFPKVRSKHEIKALRAFLLHPVKLPADTGAGPCSVTVRLEPPAIAGAMRLAGEKNRAAFIRRLIYWKFYQLRLTPVAPVNRVPVGAPAPRAPFDFFAISSPLRGNAPSPSPDNELLPQVAMNKLGKAGMLERYHDGEIYFGRDDFIFSRKQGKICRDPDAPSGI